MPRTPHVTFRSTSSSIHMNEVVDRIVQVFADVAERDAQMPAISAPGGAVCRTIADGKMWTVIQGTWRAIAGGYEIAVGPDDPYATDPLAADELWYDTALPTPLLKVRVASAWQIISLSAFAAPTVDISMGSVLVHDVLTPVDPADAANKAYVDQLIAGLSWKDPVVTASAPGENVDLTLGTLIPLDGITPAVGDRVLVKNQTDPSQNGVYVVVAGPWTRAIDMDAADELDSAAVYISQGLTQANTGWVSQTDASLVIGTDPIPWTIFVGGLPPFATDVADLIYDDPKDPGVSTNSARGDHRHFIAHELPPGGMTGNVLAKANPDDFAVHWVGSQDEVYIGPDDPDVVEPFSYRELWWDSDAPEVSAGDVPGGGLLGNPLMKLSDLDRDVGWTGNLRPPADIILPSGNITFNGDNRGVFMNGGAAIYKKSGSGIVIREHSGGTQPQIENNDGTNPRDIIDTVNGDIRYALRTELEDLEEQGLGPWTNCNYGLSNNVLGASYAQYRESGGVICVKFSVETGQGYNGLAMPMFTIPGPKPATDIRFWGRDPGSSNAWAEFQCLTNGQVQPISVNATRHTRGTFTYAKP